MQTLSSEEREFSYQLDKLLLERYVTVEEKHEVAPQPMSRYIPLSVAYFPPLNVRRWVFNDMSFEEAKRQIKEYLTSLTPARRHELFTKIGNSQHEEGSYQDILKELPEEERRLFADYEQYFNRGITADFNEILSKIIQQEIRESLIQLPLAQISAQMEELLALLPGADDPRDLLLIAAAVAGYEPIVQFLLEREGPSILERDALIDHSSGSRPLSLVAKGGHLPVVELLLRYDIPMEYQTRALMEAAENGHTNVVQKFLSDKRMSEVILKSFSSKVPSISLQVVARKGHLEILELFLLRYPIPPAYQVYALRDAVEHGQTAIVKKFLSDEMVKSTLKIEEKSKKNRVSNTVLVLAVESDHPEIASLLLEAGVEVDALGEL